jgi:hypothetical protein
MPVCKSGAFSSRGKIASTHQFQTARHCNPVHCGYGETRIVNNSSKYIREQEEISSQRFRVIQATNISLEIPASAESAPRTGDNKRLPRAGNRVEYPNKFPQHLFIKRV